MRRLLLFLSGLIVPGLLAAQGQYTLGIGHYPGRPSENFEPKGVPSAVHRNLALHRSVLASSTYDYNLCGHLLTDGLIENREPAWFELTANGKLIDKVEREFSIDGGKYTNTCVVGSQVTLLYRWHSVSLQADQFNLLGKVTGGSKGDAGYTIRLETSADGKTWTKAIERKGYGRPSGTEVSSDPNKQGDREKLFTRAFSESFNLGALRTFSYIRITLNLAKGDHWRINELQATRAGKEVQLLSSLHFSSAWMSAKAESPTCLTVDLGSISQIDGMKLHWLAGAKKLSVAFSQDGTQWDQRATVKGKARGEQAIKCSGRGRYVRLCLTEPYNGQRFALTEWEVNGTGGLNYAPHNRDTGLSLAGGEWQLQRSSEVKASGEQVSRSAFDASAWPIATVPGTVLTSYINLGAVPDPNYADNTEQISESYFHSDFWYRTTFTTPRRDANGRVWLCFDGINWKAEVYVNGSRIGQIDGAFQRARFDVTSHLLPSGNTVAVLLHCNDHFGGVKEKTSEFTQYNGGILGADNPTFHASIGWDWITTVRGRNMGLWNDVYLDVDRGIHLSDPYVETTLSLPDTAATLRPHVFVKNYTSKPVTGTLRGFIANVEFAEQVSLAAGEEKEIIFRPEDHAQLRNVRLPLWWPNGYGTPILHLSGYTFVTDGQEMVKLSYNTGLKQVTYKDIDTRLTMYVNGRRFIPLGGNWGFDEQNLRYRSREYDIAVNYHKQMNMNMIRNWVGQIGDEAFYEACDKYGIMVWQDFWLANPADGPNPDDEPLFMANARDYLRRIRHYASMGIYVGRNEGDPTATLDKALRQAVSELAPGYGYISSSADRGVSGHGPYWVNTAREYFSRQSGKLHSERGMPNVMNYESLSRMLGNTLHVDSVAWGKHDFTLGGAQRARVFNTLLQKHFGQVPQTAADYTRLAQLVNYDGYRAMYESNNDQRMGLLIWMSHSCWPSMTWDTYDYYFDTPAGYYGAKKACEPLHIQWNELTDSVQVVNLCAGDVKNIAAQVTVHDAQGRQLAQDQRSVNIREDLTMNVMPMPTSDEDGVRIIRLTLRDGNGKMLSENTYIKGKDDDLRPLMQLGSPTLELKTKTESTADGKKLTVNVSNTSGIPALMVRLVLQGEDGEQILPAVFSDNFVTLLPHEGRTLTITYRNEDSRGQMPKVRAYAINQ